MLGLWQDRPELFEWSALTLAYAMDQPCNLCAGMAMSTQFDGSCNSIQACLEGARILLLA